MAFNGIEYDVETIVTYEQKKNLKNFSSELES